MKIAVCIKQVPTSSEGDMDPKTGVLIRANLPASVNVYDLAALEAALRIREEHGAEIMVFTMGPESAKNAILTAYAMGADDGCLICDTAFAGSDVLATSYTLMQAIQKYGPFDLIICGKQTTDGDTAQVSGAVARWLEIPHMNWVTKIEKIEKERIRIKYLMEKKIVTAYMPLPCLISVEKDSFVSRMPSLKLKIAGKKKEVKRCTLNDFKDQEKGHYGLQGSPTKVIRIFPPEKTKQQDIVSETPQNASDYILSVIKYRQEDGL